MVALVFFFSFLAESVDYYGPPVADSDLFTIYRSNESVPLVLNLYADSPAEAPLNLTDVPWDFSVIGREGKRKLYLAKNENRELFLTLSNVEVLLDESPLKLRSVILERTDLNLKDFPFDAGYLAISDYQDYDEKFYESVRKVQHLVFGGSKLQSIKLQESGWLLNFGDKQVFVPNTAASKNLDIVYYVSEDTTLDLTILSDQKRWVWAANITVNTTSPVEVNVVFNIKFEDIAGVKFKSLLSVNAGKTVNITLNKIDMPATVILNENLDQAELKFVDGLSVGVILSIVFLGLGVVAIIFEAVRYIL